MTIRRKSSVPRPPCPSEYSGVQVVDQGRPGAAVVRQLLLQGLPLAAEISGDGQAGLDGGEQLGLFLDYLGKPLLDQAVQNLIDLLTGYVGARCQFQRLELRMAKQHQVGSRFVGVQPELLQPPPESLKVDLGQFIAHLLFTLAKPCGKRTSKWWSDSGS